MVLNECLVSTVGSSLSPVSMEALDLDDDSYLDEMAEGDRVGYLRHFFEPSGRRESRHGLAPTKLDRLAHDRLFEELPKLVKGSFVVGEESIPEHWNYVIDEAPSGSYIWLLDSIDGSGPQDTVAFGYATTVILYRLEDDPGRSIALRRATPYMSVTVTSSSRMLGWIYPDIVGASQLNLVNPDHGRPDLIELSEPLVAPDMVRKNWIAAVAAQAKHRKLLQPLFSEESPYTVITLGGAPALPGLLLDRLSAVVIPRPQSRHDAAPLLALAGQGLHFWDIATLGAYSDDEVRGFFSDIVRPLQSPQSNPTYLPVPAMVVSRDALVGLEIARTIWGHWGATTPGNGES